MARRRSKLASFSDPGALLGFLHGHAGTGAEKNAVLRALVIEAQSLNGHPEAATSLVLLALWPGLDAIRKRLFRFFRDDLDTLTAELTGSLSQRVAGAELDRVTWIAATFLRNIERDLKREQIRLSRETCDARIEDWVEMAEWLAHPGRDVLSTLRSHIGSDAELVMAVAIFGFSQKEAARALGLSHDAARKRYQRAISRLSTRILPTER